MKILTLICNFVLWGFAILGLMGDGLSRETNYFELKLSLLFVPALNIGLLIGSRLSLDWQILKDKLVKKKLAINQSSPYLFIKIIAIILNITLAGIAYWFIGTGYYEGGILYVIITILIMLTPVLSLIMILFGKENKFEVLIRTFFLTGIGLVAVLFGFLTLMHFSISNGIKENIRIAKEQYPGNAEEALIAYLSDSTRSFHDRGKVAVWTLGQIRSKKALPVLYKYYKNDPDGKLCKGKHNSMMCQYGLHKAIVTIENGWISNKERNWFGSFAKLNK